MIYPFKCDICNHEWDEVMSINETKKRDKGLPCPKCGGHGSRIFFVQRPIMKKTRVEDIWNKGDVTSDPLEAKKRNNERIKDMRKKSESEKRPTKIQLGYGRKSRDTEK